ncbi:MULTISPECIES: AAA family ATPase [unclassified Microcoleus]|uniref:AAA family ATPase n=1 Tax=unclassified Microcoleus TaxID=2642155 RepID=UPI002FD1DA0E
MADRNELLNHLKKLSPAQFEEVLFRLNIDLSIIPSPWAEQSLRAIRVIQRLEQEQDGLVRLEKTLAEPAISIVGKQYIGYEIEAQVRQIVSDYTQQPFEGREEEKRQLDEFLTNNSSGVLLVTAAAGFGKSALLSHWQKTRQDDFFIAYHCFSNRYEKTRSVSEAYRHLLKQLYYYYKIRNGQYPNDEYRMRDILVGMLREPVSEDGKRLVIVLDGLDEADKTFEPFFTSLSAGVFVIASARAEKGEKPEYLRNWTDNAQILPLKRLPCEAIPKWLEQISELATYSQDEDFVTRLHKTTDGLPLYLRYLLDDLRQAAIKRQDVQAVLKDSPGGFKDYVKEQFRQLAKIKEIKRQPEVQELFALLSVALGALSEHDIQHLTSLTVWDLADLPWQATRWFSIQAGIYSFAHPLLAQEFCGVLGPQASSAEGKLIEYCAKWQKKPSDYVLRHYAEHLRKAKRWEELYKLARDEEFASAQLQQLLDEPNLSLKTVQTALLGAAEEDNPEIMAEFLLLHARLVDSPESPLEALRYRSLERAWRLADRLEIERCILWYLLLTWELNDEGKLEQARETLDRLQQKNLPRFQIGATHWQGDYAAYLLAHIFEVNEEACIALQQRLFQYMTRYRLCQILIYRERFQTALKIAEGILLELKQWYPLRNILKAQIEKGNTQETKSILAKSLEITRKTFPSQFWLWGMGDVAKAQMEVGQMEEAKATFAEAIETAENLKAKAGTNILIAIANLQADVGLFLDARETLQRIDMQGASAASWISLADVQAKIGDKEQAITSLSQAKQLARNNEDKNSFYHILNTIASKQRQMGRLAEARETIEERASLEPFNQQHDPAEIFEKIQEDRDSALLKTVQEQLAAGQLEEALKTSSDIQEQSTQEDAAVEIAKAYAHAKKFSNAIEIANQLFNQVKKVELLQSIATVKLQAGLVQESRDTLAMGIKISFGSELSYQQALALINLADLLIENHHNKQGIDYANDVYKISSQIHNLKDRVNILALLGEVYTKAGQRNNAQDIFTEAIEIIQTVEKQNSPNSVKVSVVKLFKTIGIAQARAREFNGALETVQKIEIIGRKAQVLKTLAQVHPDAEQKEILKTALATIYEDALSSFSLVFDHSATTLSSIAVAQMALGDREVALAIFSEALEIVTEETTQAIKTNPDSLLSRIAADQAEAGEITLALENVNKIEDRLEQVRTLYEIAAFQGNKGDKEEILNTLNAALKAQEKITDEDKQLEAIELIAYIQAMAGQVEKAFRTAAKKLTNRHQLLCNIATILDQIQDKDNFKKLLISCAYSSDTAYKMCTILARLYPEKAESVAEEVKKIS